MQVQQDLLTDLEETIWYQDASNIARMFNLIIDYLFAWLLTFLVGAFLFPEFEGSSISGKILLYIMLLFYYSLLETATQGRTIGKLVTGTKAIRKDGTAFSGGDAVLRSLCRLVPLDTISALFGYPWHDKWTNTRVVKTRR